MDLPRLRRTADVVLALAVHETYPSVSLLGGSDTLSGFYYDFYFPHPVHPELHLQIEEKMRQIAREKREIKDLEMASVSAREFLKSRGHFDRADQVEGGGLFSVVQIGDFVDLSCGTHEKNTSGLSHFKLFPPITFEGKILRFSGTVHESKEKLKEFLKKWNSYPKRRHEKIGVLKNYWEFSDLGPIWYPEGVIARNDLIDTFKKTLLQNSSEVICPGETAQRDFFHAKLLEKLGAASIYELFSIEVEPNPVEDAGLFLPREATAIQMAFPLKNIISCLQSIEKTLNILAFNYSIRLTPALRKEGRGQALIEALEALKWKYESAVSDHSGPRLDFLVEDGLGRAWSAIEVRAKECWTVQVIVERNMALLLEIQEFI